MVNNRTNKNIYEFKRIAEKKGYRDDPFRNERKKSCVPVKPLFSYANCNKIAACKFNIF